MKLNDQQWLDIRTIIENEANIRVLLDDKTGKYIPHDTFGSSMDYMLRQFRAENLEVQSLRQQNRDLKFKLHVLHERLSDLIDITYDEE